MPRLAACFREWYRPAWDKAVRQEQVGREWYLARSEGLAAYGRYEADLRLRQAGKSAFTRGDFVLWFLGELAQINGWENAIVLPIFDDLMARRRDLLTRNVLEELLKRSKSPRGGNPYIRRYAMAYDRWPIPCEFWTDGAAANSLSCSYSPRTDRVLPFIPYDPNYGFSIKPTTAEQVRSWRRMLQLNPRKPVVVKGFRARTNDDINWEFVFVEDAENAMGVHGIPPLAFDRK
jgi:hypothetical protein